MGGHGGLNILPQKRWNVYNFDNREKVRKDEEAAAREEQLKREESRRRDAEFRLERLRQARGIEGPAAAAADDPESAAAIPPADSRHINLFEGLQDFSSLTGSGPSESGREEERKNGKEKRKRDEGGSSRDQKRKREERPAAIAPEDEKYRMCYGLAGKGVKAPWYLSRPSLAEAAEESNDGRESGRGGGRDSKKAIGGKKTIEELRAERLEREKKEKERERALLKSARKR